MFGSRICRSWLLSPVCFTDVRTFFTATALWSLLVCACQTCSFGEVFASRIRLIYEMAGSGIECHIEAGIGHRLTLYDYMMSCVHCFSCLTHGTGLSEVSTSKAFLKL